MVLIAATCRLALLDLCGMATNAADCDVCCGHHQHELRAAGCSPLDCSSYCASIAAAAATPRALHGRQFMGYNVVNLQSGNFSTDPSYIASTAALNPGTLRYPGGNLADWWDWRTGWCLQNLSVPSSPKATNPCYASRSGRSKPRRPYPLDEFATVLTKTGATPVFMLNLWTSDLPDQLQFLAYAQSIGALPEGTYVELGGEFYWGKYSGRWATGKEYGRTAVQWAQAIKSRFPHVQTLAIACHSYAYAESAPTYRGRVWNADLYPIVSSAGSGIDGVVIHPYLHLDDDTKGGGVLQPGLPPRSTGEGPTGWSANASLQQAMTDMMRSERGMEALMGVPFALRSVSEGDAATQTPLPPNLRMVVTEYNVMERAGPFKLSWAHAMFVGCAALNLLSVRAMDSVMLHVLLNGYGWGALYETTNDFQGGAFAGQPPDGSYNTACGSGECCLVAGCMNLHTTPYGLTAVGTVLGAISASMQSTMSALEVSGNRTLFPTNPQLCGGAKPDGRVGTVCYPSLLAWQFRADHVTASNITVLNLSPSILTYVGGGQTSSCRDAFRRWLSPAASTMLTGVGAAWASTTTPVQMQVGRVPLAGSNTLQLPPYSLTTITRCAEG